MESIVSSIKREIFSPKNKKVGLHKFVGPTAYETAWLAMIEDKKKPKEALFKCCLDWILKNQKGQGFWGESYHDGFPTIHSLPATLACMLALNKWKLGCQNVDKGRAFIHAAVEVLLLEDNISSHLPRWFIIVFPAMLQLARSTGLDLNFSEPVEAVVSHLSIKRQQILEMNDGTQFHPPLLSYLEALSPTFSNEVEIVKQLSKDGSFFQSPSATARAYMVTGNTKCLAYLKAFVKRCSNGETTLDEGMDEELVQLCLVDQIQRLGLAEYFTKEIEAILSQIYRNKGNHEGSRPAQDRDVAKTIYKDALAFRILRLQGYDMQQRSFCWFLQHADILNYMEEKCENLKSVLHNIYRATDVMFSGESDVEIARQFSMKLLQQSENLNYCSFDDLVMFSNYHQNMAIKHELDVPWISRLDHLDHRMWIDETRVAALWTGNTSLYRFSWLGNEKLVQLAYKNFGLRQSIYREELNELSRWSKEKGLSNMGFGREKTLYSYFATAASLYLPSDSVIRVICAKCSIAITVADDFYDEHGSIKDLHILTEAIQKWNGKDLTGHGKTIFEAVDDIVKFISSNTTSGQDGNSVETALQDIWRETFRAWMTERAWSESGYVPSMEEYLEVGHISIAAHLIVLSASCLFHPTLPMASLKPPHYMEITKLLMASSRLLNDMQSYQKEQEQGKINYVLLHMKENPGVSVEGAIEEVKRIVDEKRKALLELALKDDGNNDNKKLKQLHLGCLKVFNMFFNSSNLFDTKTALLNEINKAIYIPLDHYPDEEGETKSKYPSKQSLETFSLTELSLRRKKDIRPMSALPCQRNGISKFKLVALKKATLLDVQNGSSYYYARPAVTMTSQLFLL